MNLEETHQMGWINLINVSLKYILVDQEQGYKQFDDSEGNKQDSGNIDRSDLIRHYLCRIIIMYVRILWIIFHCNFIRSPSPGQWRKPYLGNETKNIRIQIFGEWIMTQLFKCSRNWTRLQTGGWPLIPKVKIRMASIVLGVPDQLDFNCFLRSHW